MSGRRRFGSVLRRSATIVAAIALGWQPVSAYETPLAAEAVREAYFLGQRNDQARAEFFAAYIKHLPLPQKGPYISEIELLTPYAQVVDVSRQHTAGYSAQQAAEDYKKRGDIIQVRVRIELTPTYGEIESHPPKDPRAKQGIPLRQEGFWKNFKFRLLQRGRRIEPFETYGEPIYLRSSIGSGGLAGAQVWLYYEAQDVASAAAIVEVIPPDGAKVTAEFDLERLK